MSSKVLTQALDGTLFGSTFYQMVLQCEEGRGLHGVQNGGLEVSILIQELCFQISLGCLCHQLIFGGIATSGQCHVAHHLGIYLPIAGAQIVPIADGIGQWLPVFVESQVGAAFQWLIAQPVGPLVVAVLLDECLMIVLCFVDMLHKALHSLPVLIDDGLIAKLLPNGPRYDNACIGPT